MLSFDSGPRQIVRLTRDMHPWRKGDDVALPEALAKKLVESKEAEDPRPFPPPDVAGPKPEPLLKPKRYLTRRRG